MSRTVRRTSDSTSTQALVVISPATITTPVFTNVSQATRPRASSLRMASSTTSEIWSATLSGWPSETDSDVKRKSCAMLCFRCVPAGLEPLSVPSRPHGRLARASLFHCRQPGGELGGGKAVILCAARLDLDGAHQRGNMSGLAPGEAAQQSVQEPGTVSVTAAGRVDHGAYPGGRDRELLAARVDGGTLGAARDDQRLDVREHLGHRPAGLLLHELPLVLVHRHPACLRDEALEILAGEQRQPLAGIEDERQARGGELVGVLDHARAPVGGDDAD